MLTEDEIDNMLKGNRHQLTYSVAELLTDLYSRVRRLEDEVNTLRRAD